jgi:tRNA threonylcarbamoyl adenosine modification protein (Sua5/YciO/YrdC/YwlC family)
MVEQAVAAIRAGEPVILPTDTVYGLCAAPDRAGLLSLLKGRPSWMPVALVCADVARLLELVPEVRGQTALLPGPYTLIVPNPAGRFPALGSEQTIGVRVPMLGGVTGEILDLVGAVAATSANRHGGPDPRRLEDVPAEMRDVCAVVVDGGELPGVPSTVVDLTGPEPRVLREGAAPTAETLDLLRRTAE